jgi:hypothetical protein
MTIGNTQTQTLYRALKSCGGEVALAKALKVPVETLAPWLSGHEAPSAEIYIATLKIVSGGRPKTR